MQATTFDELQRDMPDSMELITSLPKRSARRDVIVASVVVSLTMAGEYFSRHYILFWLPTFGNLIVNDMISLLLAYILLTLVCGLATGVNLSEEFRGIWLALQELLRKWDYTFWFLLMVLSIRLLPFVDQLLWRSVTFLPMITSSYKNSVELFVPQAQILKVIALVFVNGLFVPIAEEFLWRGIVQVCLLRVLPAPLAIGTTAILFSFKHVLVDASFGRFMTLIAFGAICGIVAQRKSWHASAAIHLFTNTVATVMGLAMGLE